MNVRKECVRCRLWKNIYEFHMDRNMIDGLQKTCKQCLKIQRDIKSRWMQDYKSARPCEICNESCSVCLVFTTRTQNKKT